MNSANRWINCQKQYNWSVDLNKFESRKKYPSHFIDRITPQNIRDFENKFRKSLNEGFPMDEYLVCGEVYFWKNFRSLNKNSKTTEIIEYLSNPEHKQIFIESLIEIIRNPTHSAFVKFRKACNLPNGFATPITYLSFCQSDEYPMIDKIIAFWWRDNKERFGLENAPLFSQRSDGWIQSTTEQSSIRNWNAYLEWVKFCNSYRVILTNITKTKWRARDVEMAVWESQKCCYPLDRLD
ncbi:hypothetical protein [Methanoregula sp.]|uniref:hypothetical protein n=1 Tax=Methanoregula sp. TaxID=2052170 RepID=UPI002368F605|nr:hypothetical protein [Methanoregula sp.]MDD1685933.1 hypothetical protein [Methanoregula sp.]